MYASVARASTSRTSGEVSSSSSGAWEHEHGGADEPTFRWLGREATLRLPDRPGTAALRLATDPCGRSHRTVGRRERDTPRHRRTAVVRGSLSAPAVDVVNNAGSELVLGALGADRGLYDPDGAAVPAPTEVFAWCGAGVLMPARYLQDVGVFDERLFLYSEDLELAWRGRERGWRYAYRARVRLPPRAHGVECRRLEPQALLRRSEPAARRPAPRARELGHERFGLVRPRHGIACASRRRCTLAVGTAPDGSTRSRFARVRSRVSLASRRQWFANAPEIVRLAAQVSFGSISPMAVLVTLFGVVLALLALLVAGLLRSHAEILRALHELGANLDPARTDDSSPVHPCRHPPFARPTVSARRTAERGRHRRRHARVKTR